MNYILAVFKSRYSTISFANLLKANNIPVAIINTPNAISKACGISVKFISDYFSKVQTIASRLHMSNFDGFYSLVERNNKVVVIKM